MNILSNKVKEKAESHEKRFSDESLHSISVADAHYVFYNYEFDNKAIITLKMMDPDRPLKIPITKLMITNTMLILTLTHGAERFIPLYNVKWFEWNELSEKDDSEKEETK